MKAIKDLQNLKNIQDIIFYIIEKWTIRQCFVAVIIVGIVIYVPFFTYYTLVSGNNNLLNWRVDKAKKINENLLQWIDASFPKKMRSTIKWFFAIISITPKKKLIVHKMIRAFFQAVFIPWFFLVSVLLYKILAFVIYCISLI